ncbi:beta-alanine-activating enzyme [Sabethes cyaneus]|uniref:beta-alanine-activating enzyme n=1 Tax=Sabethes cyaneus TaxID=53552 RepID=UPI00237E6105|nr:beta-alanine-activating enzyme [Sabethes cyaneus]
MLDTKVFAQYSNHNVIYYHSKDNKTANFTYSQLWNAIESVRKALRNQKLPENCSCIAVSLTHAPALIAVVVGIHVTKFAFCCLNIGYNIKNISLILQRIGTCYTFCYKKDVKEFESNSFEVIFELNLLDEFVCLVKFSTNWSNVIINKRIAYCVLTSGSTGNPKLVKVSSSCILPNLERLEHIFNISLEDRIFIASPPSFDPFIVDVFLALRNGASLILVANEIRLDADRLLRVLYDQINVTFIQITPSLFRRWDERSIQEVIFRKDSSLRNLILGGEPFPTDLRIPNGSRTNIYNIYGITEISCWTTIEKVKAEHICNNQVSIGSPLDQTILLQLRKVDNNEILDLHQILTPVRGELYIGSRTRKCLVDNEETEEILDSDEVCYRRTGDLVELRSDRKFYYLGRCDQVVKRLGIRVSLTHLEDICDRCQSIAKSFAVFDEAHQKVILFYTICNKPKGEDIEQQLRASFKCEELPDEFVKVDNFLLSAHGKIDKKALLNRYLMQNSTEYLSGQRDISQYFAYKMDAIFGNCLENQGQHKRMRLDTDYSFLHVGGTSIQAVQLVTYLQENFNASIPDLIGLLLDETVSLRQIHSYLAKINSSASARHSSIEPKENSTVISVKACFNMDKCIDATPSVFNSKLHNRTIVSVGSHSHKIIIIGTNPDSSIISQLVLPNRVESSVAYLNDLELGLVGCYDGYFYCFDLWSSEVRWKFDSRGMIKCKALVIDGFIIFGNYSSRENLFALDVNGVLVWKLRLGTKGILSSPIAINERVAFVATLDGTCRCFKVIDGSEIWTKKLQSAVFANSMYIRDYQTILVPEVQGCLHCLCSQSGSELWKISTDGNIFSSPLLQRKLTSAYVLLGCHDKHLYCFQCNKNAIKLHWKLRLQSPIYSSPVALDDQLIIVCSTSGYVNLISTSGVSILSVLKLDGEIFSTPVVVHPKKLYIGCRDNYLYQLTVSL